MIVLYFFLSYGPIQSSKEFDTYRKRKKNLSSSFKKFIIMQGNNNLKLSTSDLKDYLKKNPMSQLQKEDYVRY